MNRKPSNKNNFIYIKEIQKILPHRYPFLLVDRVLDLKKGKSIKAIKNVTYNEPFFNGHFPEHKIMPGVLIIEALAQSGGILLYHSLPDPDDKIVLLSKIKSAKFRKPVIPGDQIEFHVDLVKARNRFCEVKGKAYVDEEVVVESEVIAYWLHRDELNE
jgi:3-hydroxyacyl-[acyl-carrier-protein] dehydratase/UDP-3-O-[3-hydroxymyristoyl] N-acetylglucosamine deacetylase/3-hydroxyacyl-[acyl-carrier-protein] dehydratase